MSVIGAQVPLVSILYNVDGDQRLHNQPFTWGMGMEFAVADVVFLRTGFMEDPGDEHDLDGSAWGVGLGVPARALRVRFDYTHTSRSYQPDIYGIALSCQL